VTRAGLLALSDAELVGQCDVDTYRASGPGGQKRNKTSSAVRLRHRPTGLRVIAEESRSQHENKATAVKRLRQAVVLHLREPAAAGRPEIAACGDGRLGLASAKDPRFWPAAGVALDAVAGSGGQLSTAAELLGVSTANLGDFLALHPKVWQEANRIRVECGLAALRS
jgi:hypothetical protein